MNQPDLERISYLERWAQKHRNGIRWTLQLAVLVFAAFLAALLFLPEKGEIAPPTHAVAPKASLPTPATKAPVSNESPARQSASGLSDAQEAVKQQIWDVAKEEGYEAPRFLSRLAFCESSLNPSAKSATSSARGLFQILKTHEVSDACAYDTTCATKWTIHQLKAGHASWWKCTDIIS